MPDRYKHLVDQLLALVEPGFGGQPRPEFVARISTLTRDIESEAGNDGYIRQKTAGVREWVEIACTTRKHALWGLSVVEDFAYQNAWRLARAAGRKQA